MIQSLAWRAAITSAPVSLMPKEVTFFHCPNSPRKEHEKVVE